MFPLKDINVLSLENGISAPMATRLLGDFGAEVVKIERPEVGDVNRHWDNSVNGDSSAHAWVNRNKKSIELDLKSDEGTEIFHELARDADVIVQNYSPGVVDRLDLGYETISELNESIVYLNISGYGRDGPYKERKAYDLVMQGETGLILMNGSEDEPAKIPLSLCDINTAMYSTIGVLTALFHRERTGEGQELDITMFGGMLSWLGYFPHKYWHEDKIPERVGMRHHLITPYGPHETSDNQYINFGILSNSHWETFCNDIIDRPDLADDPRFDTNEKRTERRDEFEPIIEDIISSESRDYWAERLADAGLPWGDVNQLDEVLNHPQTEHLDMVREFETNDGPVNVIDNPLDFDSVDIRRDWAPDLGEHTDELLRNIGYEPEEIEELRTEDVV